MAIANKSNIVFVYNGPGVDSICLEQMSGNLEKKYGKNYSIIKADGSYLNREIVPLTYVLPGGKALLMGEGLEKSIDKIKQCVNQGSGVLASCAGAMVLSSHWNYLLPTDQKPYYMGIENVQARFRLNLGPYAFAPAFIDKYVTDDSFKEPEPRMVDIVLPLEKNESFKCFWNQGPVFRKKGEYDILGAEYKYVSSFNPLIHENQFSAVIFSDYGYGNTVLLGVHPELAQWCTENGYSLSEHDMKWNDYLFEKCCNMAGLTVLNKQLDSNETLAINSNPVLL